MAMESSGPGGVSSSINVTPLIDVLLVLLIIFMVIVPVTPKGLSAQVPLPPDNQHSVASPETVVVSVLHQNGSPAGNTTGYRINQEDVAKADLLARLTAIYANRAERIVFVKGDDDVAFARIAEVIDISHAAGVNSVGLLNHQQ